MASLSRLLAEGLRRAMLLGPPEPAARPDGDAPAGLALLAADNTIAVADAAAERWLDELANGRPGDAPPPVVTAVASRARGIADGGDASGVLARARVRAASGQWLLVRASRLGDGPDAQTAVIIEPARSHELAPLAADAYGLTERERAVTELVAHGLATDAIAARLHVSPWTVQDHLKAIFEKVGARTRGELVARVFFEPHAPQLTRRR